MSEVESVRKILSNIRSLRAFAREVDFALLEDMSEKLNSVVEERRADAEREAKERQQRETRKRELLEMINSEGFSVSELLGDSTAEAGRKKRVVQQVPAKYQFEVNGEMQYWTGRGRKPKAIEEALAAGKKLDDFLIPDSEK
ncbi:TPA: H-NS family nucleoid-associated regulatory protein [Salmonella enterica subsp. enterica serovar Saintpaul]|uniref:H-NS family histone-like protein n=1 Tax=Escherichia coli TaxID=562 RepID=UPI00092DB46A|nr:H-NS family nucleoid-associated regulatory protein [Escherichia coli]EAB5564127.1 DNA-binding protein [Salmonella enterica subsp. enterica serovar Enteritidis]EAV4564942.1 DNA-binding protein [Salmonella enterica]EBG0049914.1 DNA-binding protein [Salmonella enterica subsp. enterica serovar Stanley]EBX3015953.1 DNA-binding protein [Salmonella enterica subsp. enterica serovar Typhimurium]ECA7134884.1 DNA-binding protein [Salmonella enterica subsp. enterica serovar Altona]ECB3179021.1 DNA-bin